MANPSLCRRVSGCRCNQRRLALLAAEYTGAQLMIRAAFIAAALFAASPASAKSRCMGAHRTLCAFAQQHKLKVISGYRPGARIAGTRRVSLHAKRRAIDVRGCRSACIRAARARGFGIGIYRGRHVHLSIGKPEAGHTFYRGFKKRRTRYGRR